MLLVNVSAHFSRVQDALLPEQVEHQHNADAYSTRCRDIKMRPAQTCFNGQYGYHVFHFNPEYALD
jgi:hypothetical protein